MASESLPSTLDSQSNLIPKTLNSIEEDPSPIATNLDKSIESHGLPSSTTVTDLPPDSSSPPVDPLSTSNPTTLPITTHLNSSIQSSSIPATATTTSNNNTASTLNPSSITVPEADKKLFMKCYDWFTIFDQMKSGMCDVREAGTILRAFGVYPSEAKLIELYMLIQDPTQPGKMHFEQFIKIAFPLITSKAYPQDTDDQLYQAFLALDNEKKGYIGLDELKTLLTTKGETMTVEEFEVMISNVDKKENRFYYEDYLSLLQ